MTRGRCSARISDVSYPDLPLIFPCEEQSSRCLGHIPESGASSSVSSSSKSRAIDNLQKFPKIEWSRIPLLSEVLDILPPNTCLIVEVNYFFFYYFLPPHCICFYRADSDNCFFSLFRKIKLRSQLM